MIHMKCR